MYTARRVICGIYSTKTKTRFYLDQTIWDPCSDSQIWPACDTLTDCRSQHMSLQLNVRTACYLQVKNLPFQSFGIKGNLPAARPLATSGTFQKVLQLKTYLRSIIGTQKYAGEEFNIGIYRTYSHYIYKYVHLLTSWQKRGIQCPHRFDIR
jgi:hypothetical protein